MLTVGIFGPQDIDRGGYPRLTHDHGLALMREGAVITVVQLERLTGLKHDNRLPEYISGLLDQLVPANERVRFVLCNHFLGDSFISADGRFRIEPEGRPGIEEIIYPARCLWYPDGAHRRRADAWVICHEFAHIATCLPFCGAFESGALLVHVDGGASRSASSFWHAEGATRVRCLGHSWDELKDFVNNFNDSRLARALLGLGTADHLSMPGKLMGLAAHGRARDSLYHWLRERRWLLDQRYGDGELRSELGRALGGCPEHLGPEVPQCQDVAACLQRAFEENVPAAVLARRRATGATKVYYSGGAAMNILGNRRLEAELGVGQLFVPPAPSDAGLALGAAAYLEYLEHGGLPIHEPCLERTPPVALGHGPSHAAVETLLAGGIVGVCVGGGEIGPRALGHRSLLARADRPQLTRHLSQVVKGREWYRPVAPVMAEGVAEEVLGPDAVRSQLSRYMAGAYLVPEAWQHALSGTVHADGSVRVQIVREADEENRWLYRLLQTLWEKERMPALINTSFNRCGMPIVHTDQAALTEARTMGLDAVQAGATYHQLRNRPGN